LVPETHDGRARHEEISGEGIEHALAFRPGQTGGRLICVAHEMVAEFMREAVPTTPGVCRPIDDRHPQTVYLD
jgi:hypothetical protein